MDVKPRVVAASTALVVLAAASACSTSREPQPPTPTGTGAQLTALANCPRGERHYDSAAPRSDQPILLVATTADVVRGRRHELTTVKPNPIVTPMVEPAEFQPWAGEVAAALNESHPDLAVSPGPALTDSLLPQSLEPPLVVSFQGATRVRVPFTARCGTATVKAGTFVTWMDSTIGVVDCAVKPRPHSLGSLAFDLCPGS